MTVPASQRRFASDLLNLTLASPAANRTQKNDKDAAEWLPAMARDADGETPLHRAFTADAIAVLLAAGADPMARDVEGRTPLHSRASLLNSAMIAALLAAGADLEARDEDGNTPLHRAAAYGVVYGDDPDARFHAGRAIEALLDAGANAMARNAAGETAWDLAQANEALQGADGYWRLNNARFGAPGGGGTRDSATTPAWRCIACASNW